MRIPAFALGIVLAAGFAACIAPTASWPLSSGLGGVAGDAIVRVVERVFGDLVAGWVGIVPGLIFGLSALAALSISIGFGFNREYEADEEPENEDGEATQRLGWSPSAWLGAFTHSFFVLKARLFHRRARQKAVRSAVRQFWVTPRRRLCAATNPVSSATKTRRTKKRDWPPAAQVRAPLSAAANRGRAAPVAMNFPRSNS